MVSSHNFFTARSGLREVFGGEENGPTGGKEEEVVVSLDRFGGRKSGSAPLQPVSETRCGAEHTGGNWACSSNVFYQSMPRSRQKDGQGTNKVGKRNGRR